MSEFLLIFAVITGGLIGWMIRHWYFRRDLISRRREQQLARTGLSEVQQQGTTESLQQQLDMVQAAKIDADERAVELEAQLATAESGYSDLTQSFTFKDEEIDELFQIASKVKPLEFELAKSRAEIRRLKAISGEAHSDSAALSSAGLDAEVEASVDGLAALKNELVAAQRELSLYQNDSTRAFSEAELNTGYESELDELYKTASQVKPLEYELRRKVAEIEKLKKHHVSNRALSDGNADDQAHALRAEIDDLKEANRELLQERERSARRLLVIETELAESDNNQLRENEENDHDMHALRSEVEHSRSVAQELEKVEQLLSEQEQIVESSEGLESILRTRDQEILELKAQLSEHQIRSSEINEAVLLTEEKLCNQLAEQQERLEEADKQRFETQKLSARNSDQKQLIESQQRQVLELKADKESSQQELKDAIRLIDEKSENVVRLESVSSEKSHALNGLEEQVSTLYLELESAKVSLSESDQQLLEMADLRSTALEAEQQVATLRMVADKVPSLESQLAERDLEIGRIKSRLIAMEDLKESLTGRDTELAVVQAELESVRESSSRELDGVRTQLTQSRDFEKKFQQQQQINAVLIETSQKLPELESTLAERDATIVELTHDTRKLSEVQQALRNTVSENDVLKNNLSNVNQLQRELEEREIQIKALQAIELKFEDSRRLITEQSTQLEVFSQKADQLPLLEEQLKLRSEELSVVSEEVSQLRRMQPRLETLQRQADDVNNLQETIVGLETRLTSRKRELLKLHEERHSDQIRHNKLTEQWDRQQEKIAGLQQQANQIAPLKKAITENEERMARQSEKIKALQSEKNQLTVQMTGGGRLLQRQTDKVAILEEDLARNAERVLQLSSEVKNSAGLQQSLDQKEREIQALGQVTTRVTQLENELLNKEKRLSRVPELEADIRERDSVIAKLRDDTVKPQVELQKIATLSGEITSLQSRIQHSENMNARIPQLEDQLAASVKRAKAADSLSEKVSTSDFLIEQLKNDIAESELQLNARENEIAVLKKANTRIDELEHEISKHREQSGEFANQKQQLLEAQDKLKIAERALSSLQSTQRVLTDRESDADNAKQNDLELRRLRSESQTILQQRDVAIRNSAELKQELREQVAKSLSDEKKLQELAHMQANVGVRDQQITHLKKRLLELESEKKTGSSKADSDSRKPENLRAKAGSPHKVPLDQAPNEKDDLKKIYGIGPVMEKMLNSLGITSFAQIANFKEQDIDKVTDAIEAFPGRIQRDNWVGGATKEFNKKYGKATTT